MIVSYNVSMNTKKEDLYMKKNLLDGLSYKRFHFWIGAFNTKTKQITEVHKEAEAKKWDYQACYYFSDEVYDSLEKNESVYFCLEYYQNK